MFKLAKNLYTQNGRCIYEDEHGNSLFVKRTEKGFVVKIRFDNEAIKAKPLYINIPIEDDVSGISVHVDYPSVVDYSTFVEPIVMGTSEIINRWIGMVYDMMILESHKGMDPIILREDIERLKEYEEMEELITAISF